jgi:hypothetical protein
MNLFLVLLKLFLSLSLKSPVSSKALLKLTSTLARSTSGAVVDVRKLNLFAMVHIRELISNPSNTLQVKPKLFSSVVANKVKEERYVMVATRSSPKAQKEKNFLSRT